MTIRNIIGAARWRSAPARRRRETAIAAIHAEMAERYAELERAARPIPQSRRLRQAPDAVRSKAVPRYFFNIENHVRENDTEGVELSGPDEAREQAVIFAGDVLSESPGLVLEGGKMRVAARDESGAGVLTVVITIEPSPA